MNTIDRLLFASYVRSFFICLVSLLTLYVVVDLFTNVDDFSQESKGLGDVLTRIGSYYCYRLVQIFDRLCEAIVLLAAMFTVAWVQSNNEMLPMLSAGVSTRRVLRPVLLASALFLAVGSANQEFVIPEIAAALSRDRADPGGDRGVEVDGVYDTNGVHIEGVLGERKTKSIQFCYVTLPDHLAGGLIHLSAQRAVYTPPDPDRPDADDAGGFLLTGTMPLTLEGWTNLHILRPVEPGKYFLRTERVDFDSMTRPKNWHGLASTPQLSEMLHKGDVHRMTPLAVAYHMRLARPVLGMLLVILGLSLILRDQNQHMFISAGLCLAMCAVFFGAVLACKQLGEGDYLAPALAAWLPVMVFGPLAVTLFDSIHT